MLVRLHFILRNFIFCTVAFTTFPVSKLLKISIRLLLLYVFPPIMKLSRGTVLLGLVSFSHAVCNSASSKAWPVVISPDDTAVEACHKSCINELIMLSKQSYCLQKCLYLAGLGPDTVETRALVARVTLTCTSKETCYKYTDGSFLCLDPDTGSCFYSPALNTNQKLITLTIGSYHDDVGGVGDVNTGAYSKKGNGGSDDTEDVGSKETGVGTTNLKTSTRASSAATTSAARSGSSPTTTPSSAPTGTAVAGAAPTGGAERLRAGGIIGAVGLAVGLIL